MLKSALLLGAGIAIGAGAIQGLHAATGPMVYTVYEATVKDEAAYTAALPEVDKYIKEQWRNPHRRWLQQERDWRKARAPIGNRYVIIRWESDVRVRQGRGRRHQGMDKEELLQRPGRS